MIIHCAHNGLVSIHDLKPHPKNENVHTQEQIERLAKILLYQGWRKPIIVSNQSGVMVTGHCSLLAAKFNKWDSVPVSYQDFIDSDQETAHRVADNAIAHWADIDLSVVNYELQEMDPSFDLEMLGLKGFKVDASEKPTKACPQCGYVKAS